MGAVAIVLLIKAVKMVLQLADMRREKEPEKVVVVAGREMDVCGCVLRMCGNVAAYQGRAIGRVVVIAGKAGVGEGHDGGNAEEQRGRQPWPLDCGRQTHGRSEVEELELKEAKSVGVAFLFFFLQKGGCIWYVEK